MKQQHHPPSYLNNPYSSSSANQNFNQYAYSGLEQIQQNLSSVNDRNRSQPILRNSEKSNYHFVKKDIQDPYDPPLERGRKKFPAQETEIRQAHIFSTPHDPLNQFAGKNYEKPYFDRNLDTFDIPGSQPGTLQSKVVRNKEMAKKINDYHQNIEKGDDQMVRDSLDIFQRKYQDSTNQAQIPKEIFDENAFGDDHKVALGIKDLSFDAAYRNEENFKRSFSNNQKQTRNPPPPPEQNETEEDYENFKTNFSNFYKGYTPDEYSKRRYPQAKRILKAYENIREDLERFGKEKEEQIKKDPAFAKSVRNFFGVEDERSKSKNKPEKSHKKTKSKSRSKSKDIEEEKEIVTLQREIAETEQRLRNLYIKKNIEKTPIQKATVPKKINPTYLSYAGSEISYGIKNDKKKYEIDVIGNIRKQNDEMEKSFHTVDGIKRFGAGLKNLNHETTMNPIPSKYQQQYHI